jgi:recombination protein RecT
MSSTAVVEVRTAIENMAPQFKAALPSHVPVERFVRTTLTAVQTNPQLMQADRRTLFAAATKAAQMGLMPDGREGAIVTFKDQAQWMPMVAGIMKLVRNSGEISTWSVQAVYENDSFDFCLGDDEHITHKPTLASRGKMIAVYSIVTMKDGEKSREVMSVEDVEAIRRRSRSGQSGPWVTDFAEMAKKTVVHRHRRCDPRGRRAFYAAYYGNRSSPARSPARSRRASSEAPEQTAACSRGSAVKASTSAGRQRDRDAADRCAADR